MPILLHVALWIAPIPYALLLLVMAPSIWTLPLMGIAWQALGVCLLIAGHSAPRYRPALLAPFYVVGYALLVFGFTVAVADPILAPASLTLIVLSCIGTSAMVMLDRHPAWTAFVGALIPQESKPYAFSNAENLFLLLSAWLAAIWLQYMLGITTLTLPRQGIALVVFATLWFLLGGVLKRFPGVVAWPVISAGWFLWTIGLLEVFYSPTEALITVLLGLIVSAEALRRTRATFWIPVFIGQLLFTTLQLSTLFALSGWMMLLLVAMLVSIVGMILQRRAWEKGAYVALTGAIVALGIWLVFPGPISTTCMILLAVCATVIYRDWRGLILVYGGFVILTSQIYLRLEWSGMLTLGVLQWIVGAELARKLRAHSYHTLAKLMLADLDWATPFLWAGALCCGTAIVIQNSAPAILLTSFVTAELLAIYSVRLRVFQLPYISLVLMMIIPLTVFSQAPGSSEIKLAFLTTASALAAIAIRWLTVRLLDSRRMHRYQRWFGVWLRPLLSAAPFLAGVSAFGIMLGNAYYHYDLVLTLVNAVLLEAFVLHVYSRQRQILWVWSALTIAGYTWITLLITFNLNHPAWITLPLGLALLLMAERSTPQDRALLHWAGSLVWIIGAALSVDRTALVSPGNIVPALHILALLVYGARMGRRIPFGLGLALTLCAFVFLVAKVNIWLIPFLGGTVLISATLILEMRRESAERWLSMWATRWKQWQ